MINENLYNDLFLESHSKLAIKSLQTLSGFGDILIIKNEKTNELSIINLEVTDWKFSRILENIKTHNMRTPMYIGEFNTTCLNIKIMNKYLRDMFLGECHIIFGNKMYFYNLNTIQTDLLDDEYTETKIILEERFFY